MIQKEKHYILYMHIRMYGYITEEKYAERRQQVSILVACCVMNVLQRKRVREDVMNWICSDELLELHRNNQSYCIQYVIH